MNIWWIFVDRKLWVIVSICVCRFYLDNDMKAILNFDRILEIRIGLLVINGI